MAVLNSSETGCAGRLLIRADATAKIGTGHVMRCLALAQAWQDIGGDAAFAMASIPPAVRAKLKVQRCGVHNISAPPGSSEDTLETSRLAANLGATWVVVDGYVFNQIYYSALKASGLKVLAVDDYGHAQRYEVDLVLNQNAYAEPGMYEGRAVGARPLLGARYVLLRREFYRLRGWQRDIAEVARRILVTLGGSDFHNTTALVLKALSGLALEDLEVVAVAGATNRHIDSLKSAIEAFGPGSRLAMNVEDMPSLMEWADLAITAGGSTCWETAFMGLPSLAFVVADNQRRIAERLHAAGVAMNLGHPDALDWKDFGMETQALLSSRAARARMAQAGQALVDGYGPDRVVSAMMGQVIWLRQARPPDCEMLWKWASDPVTRANSFSSNPIPWEDHRNWYAARLGDTACLLFIACDAVDRAVGYIRFDVAGGEATISICVAPEHRGAGLGRVMIVIAAGKLLKEGRVRCIHAYIRPENLASIKVFAGAGFEEAGTAQVKGVPALHFLLMGDRAS